MTKDLSLVYQTGRGGGSVCKSPYPSEIREGLRVNRLASNRPVLYFILTKHHHGRCCQGEIIVSEYPQDGTSSDQHHCTSKLSFLKGHGHDRHDILIHVADKKYKKYIISHYESALSTFCPFFIVINEILGFFTTLFLAFLMYVSDV